MWRASLQQYRKYVNYANRNDKHYRPVYLDIPDDNFPSYGRVAMRESRLKFRTVADTLEYSRKFNDRMRNYLMKQANPDYMHAGNVKFQWNYSSLLHTFLWRGERMCRHNIVIPQEVPLADVSLYQILIDWSKFTLRGAIIKAGQRNYADPQFANNWSNARASGVPRGSYWFYDSRQDPVYQATLWASLIKSDQGELMHCADYEESYGGQYAGPAHFRKFLEEFQRLSGLPDNRIAIYTGYYYWIGHSPTNLTDLNWFAKYELWLAWYTLDQSNVLIPKPWDNSRLVMWQWTSKGNGYEQGMQSANLDLNWFNGTQSEYKNRFGLGAPPPPGGNVETWIVNDLPDGLRVRSGPNSTYGQVQSLWSGDKIEGVLDTAYNWINISKIIRVSGSILSPISGSWWCSGNALYVTKLEPMPPPVKKIVTIKADLASGSVVTRTYDDGSQESETA